MKRRTLIQTLAMTALGGGLFLHAATPADAGSITAGPADGLAVGQSFRFDPGLKLTFVKVRKDNRCPMGALCITEGDAVVVLRAHLPHQEPRTYTLHTRKSGQHVSIPAFPPGTLGFKTYSVSLVSLTPRPSIGKKTKPSDYRLRLSVDVAW